MSTNSIYNPKGIVIESEYILLQKQLEHEIQKREEAQKLLEEKNLELQRVNEELSSCRYSASQEFLDNLQLLNEYKKAIDYSTLVSITDKKGIITYANDAFVKLSGYSKEELLGSPHNIIRHPSSPPEQFKSMWETLFQKRAWHGVLKNLSKDKETYYVDTTITPILDKTGEIEKFMAIRQDVTELVEATQIIEDERNRTTAIMNEQEGIVLLSSNEKDVTFINQTFFDTFPFDDLNDFKTKHSSISELFLKDNGCLFNSDIHDDWTNPMFDFPNGLHIVCMMDRKNEKKFFSVQAKKVLLDKSHFFLFSFTDITKIKLMEQELETLNSSLKERVIKEVAKNKEKTNHMLQQSRLAQIGEMLSMIAHQWRQPLASISSITGTLSLDIMMDNYKKEFFEERLESINSLTQHLSSTIDDFRDFFKAKKETEETTLDNILNSSLAIISPVFESKNITVEHTSSHPEIILNTYVNELRQIILNIMKNAEDVLLERKVPNAKIWIYCYKDDNYATFSIEDNAGGIPEEHIPKIFDPYFSTKHEKDGTGLGLYMSKTIIEEHCKGKLSVSNTENGAKFIIQLPI
ncbi:PAS domain S-box protein [Sulfurimonas aquatica]|uniref:histidine kinase n=1 Tax=Sulfurimonas aquatica TaxID=2672570 RepID=A0A975AZT4_9BACT|nr:HAMP domain-containing sensor histidine kinase [Sulfurimonas aquatica]QSZ41611.1 PAS domain S-box protein [Sulfurimonas aquatica]